MEYYMAENKCKYYKLVRQVSYNSGQTWSNVDPPQYQQGDLYELHSADCPSGDTPTPTGTTFYSWADSGTTCSGTSLYVQQIKQVSYDGGLTWQNVEPIETNYGALITECSLECGGIPRFTFYFDDGDTITECCGDDDSAHWEEGKAEHFTGMTIGECVYWLYRHFHYISLERVTFQSNENLNTIGDDAFSGCGLTSITIPDSVQIIGSDAFANCSNLGEIVIGCNVESIGQRCFISIGGNNNLTNVSVYFKSTTPPTYDTTSSDKRLIHAFPRYINGPTLNVYVPNEALEAYSYHFPSGESWKCNLYGYNPSPCDYYYNPPSGVDYKYYGVLNIGNTTPDEDGIPRPYKLIEADETTTLSCDETIFNGVTHVKKVFVGEGITSACIATSNHFELEEIEFPSTIEVISGDFSRTSMTKATIKALTPPIVGRTTFGSNSEYPIYVPNSALADYKSSIYWTYQTNYVDRLVGY